MVRLERERMGRAIARAREMHPKVQYLWWRSYLVTSPRSGNQYTVTFQVTNGQKFAECSCKAGQAHVPCFHVAAAAAVQIGVAGMRRATSAA